MANEEHLAFPGQFSDIYDRLAAGTAIGRPYFREAKLAQGAELNDAFSHEQNSRTRVGNLVARDGDRIDGADIVIEREEEESETGTLVLAAGKIYLQGDIRPVSAGELTDVPLSGEVSVGVRLVSTVVTHEENAALLGLHEGTAAYGEDGAIRDIKTLSWGYDGDGAEGDLFQVYLLKDGYVVDQTPPPSLSGVTQQIAVYDYDAHENYIARGCEVAALGSDGDGNQVFAIAAGTANILGFKRTHLNGLRFSQPEEPDMRVVTSEPHVFADGGGGTAEIAVNRPPINGVTSVVITKQTSETVTRGGVANTSDILSNPGVTEIVSVEQGETTFAATTDYTLDGDRVDWSPGGDEPATSSSYQVTYKYLEAVTPDDVDSYSVVVSGGVTGSPVFVSYTYKLPRHDRICFDRSGAVTYIKGIAAVDQPQPPRTPAELLSLAVVKNDWFGTPTVVNDGARAISFATMTRYFNRLVDLLDLTALERLRRDIDSREPTAKHGVFVDPFADDRYRDAGESQNGAVFNGTFQIPIVPSFDSIRLGAPVHLDYQEVIAVRQEAVTGCMKVNPYQVFAPVPPVMTIEPSQDFWTETNEQWLSPSTQVFSSGNTTRTSGVETVTTSAQSSAQFLRQISVAFSIRGFGAGETLSSLTFDGLDVTPAGPLVADEDGEVAGSFVIPANVTAGAKLVRAVGGSGVSARARFVGEGLVETITRQQTFTVVVEQVDPPARTQEPSVAVDGTPAETETAVNENVFRGASVGVESGYLDPLAQSFALPESQHVTCVSVRFCAIGDRTKPVICEIVTMENGWPTTEVVAQTEIDMNTVLVNTWHRFDFNIPVFLSAGRQYAFVFKTDDADHSLAIAERGGFDAARQRWVGAQPYNVGVLFSSSNAITWTAHQDADLAFRIHCARFNSTTKTVALGTIAVEDMSDFIVRAPVFLPTGDARLLFEVQPEGEQAVRIEPGQVWERQSYFTGTVALRAILSGSSLTSPIMGQDVLAIAGEMQADGVYVSRAFDIGDDVRLDVVAKTTLPAGATFTVEYDAFDDNWTELEQASAAVLADGTLERTFSDDSITAVQGRVRLTLTGGPAARPAVSDLRAFTL